MPTNISQTPIRDKYVRMQNGEYDNGINPGEVISSTMLPYGVKLGAAAFDTNSNKENNVGGATFTEGALNKDQLNAIARAVAMHMTQHGTDSGIVNGYGANHAMGVNSYVEKPNSISNYAKAAVGNAEALLPSILGSFHYETDEDGNTWIDDTFDFSTVTDERAKQNLPWIRQKMADIAPENPDGTPNPHAPRTVINLGNLNDLLGEVFDNTNWGDFQKGEGYVNEGMYHRLKPTVK